MKVEKELPALLKIILLILHINVQNADIISSLLNINIVILMNRAESFLEKKILKQKRIMLLEERKMERLLHSM
jgi:hypothetical protein